MTRLISSIKIDLMVQVRNKFYHIGIGVAVFIAFIIVQFTGVEALFSSSQAATQDILPVFFLLAVGGTTMMFAAGLILFEKGERTLDALIVSPVRVTEYINARIITLTALATLESVIVILLSYVAIYGLDGFNPLPMLAGIILLGSFLCLVGFVLVVRYDSITDFLLPAIVIGLATQIPFLYVLDVVSTPLFLLLPTTPQTILMSGAFRPLELWEWAYSIGYSVLALVMMYRWSLHAFQKFIVLKERN